MPPLDGNHLDHAQAAHRRARLCAAFRWMLLARFLDDKSASLYRGGKIHGGVFLSRGQEALSTAIGMALQKGDVFAPLIRDTAGRLAFGESVIDAVRTLLGSPLGPMRGRDGNVHRGHPKEGLLPMISHLGAMISVVNGILLARRIKGSIGTVGAASIGEGGTSTGAFHEAVNQAAVEKLPMVIVIANNRYAYSTPNSRQFACQSLVDKAIGYGVRGEAVDGTNMAECLRVLEDAVERARSGLGPQMIVATFLRLCGHGEHDDASYIDPQLKLAPAGRDCLKVFEEFMLSEGFLSPSEVAEYKRQTIQQVEDAVAAVQREAPLDPYRTEWKAIATSHLCEAFTQS
jgi:pyruvate dehydrogenase E1 component alpha subunit/2-oxoisovalerate dehydrogenase E1 component alpha subunit